MRAQDKWKIQQIEGFTKLMCNHYTGTVTQAGIKCLSNKFCNLLAANVRNYFTLSQANY
jgi:hypothetical protein